QTTRILTNQLNFTVDFNTSAVVHNLSTGLELTREELGTGGYAALDDSVWSPANLYDPDPSTAAGLVTGDNGTWSRARTDTAGIYAFDTMKFGERWMLVAVGRLDRYRTQFESVVACGGRSTPAC